MCKMSSASREEEEEAIGTGPATVVTQFVEKGGGSRFRRRKSSNVVDGNALTMSYDHDSMRCDTICGEGKLSLNYCTYLR